MGRMMLLLCVIDPAVAQTLADRAVQGGTFWAMGCLGGASVRMVGQWLRAR